MLYAFGWFVPLLMARLAPCIAMFLILLSVNHVD